MESGKKHQLKKYFLIKNNNFTAKIAIMILISLIGVGQTSFAKDEAKKKALKISPRKAVDDSSTYVRIGFSSISNSWGVAVGAYAQTVGDNGIAIGKSAVSYGNSVALGQDSIADDMTISVGSKRNKLYRKIINVKDGAISIDSHEAITGGQLCKEYYNKKEIDKKLVNKLVNKKTYIHINGKDGFLPTETDPAKTNLDEVDGKGGAVGWYATAIGIGAQAIGGDSIAIGTNAKAKQGWGIAIGNNAEVNKEYGIAIGMMATSNRETSLALGYKASANGISSLALGGNAKTNSLFSIALGDSSNALGKNSIAFGVLANTKAENAVAFGREASAIKEQAIALGVKSNASGYDSVSIGASATSSADHAVSLGSLSIADRAGYKADTYGAYSGTNLKGITWGAVSVGGLYNGKQMLRQITNVADATNATDAVNLRQLKAAIDGINVVGINPISVNKTETGAPNINVTTSNVGTTPNPAPIPNSTWDKKFEVNVDLSGQANLDLGNITNTGTKVIQKTAQNAVKIAEGNNIEIQENIEVNGNKTYTISAISNGIIESGNQGLVTGDTIYQYQQQQAEILNNQSNRINQNANEITSLGKRLNHMGSLSAALAGLHPMQYDPMHPNQVMAAVGAYRDSQAVAVGATHYFNENLMMTAGLSMGIQSKNQEVMGNLGFTWKIGNDEAREEITNLPYRYDGKQMASVYMMQTEMDRVLYESKKDKEKINEQAAQIQNLTERLERLERLEKLLSK